MARDNDSIDDRIDCLRTDRIPATLISTSGYHCEVWRAAGTIIREDERRHLDVVIKVHRTGCTWPETRVIRREYTRLSRELGHLVPETVYIATRVNEVYSVVALADAVNRWFDVANPSNEDEAVPLFQRLRRARDDLAMFIERAEAWEREDRVIDLYGRENLVLDSNRHLRYIDSFGVFFYADLLNAIDEPDPALQQRIDLSRRRLDYLRHLLEASAKPPRHVRIS
jgi:hypothetical protein